MIKENIDKQKGRRKKGEHKRIQDSAKKRGTKGHTLRLYLR